jgi:hypothetical protein
MPWRMEVALFVGVQGSGKTSFSFSAFRRCAENTLPKIASRFSGARANSPSQERASAYWFDVPLADALARNAVREGERRIPDNVFESTHARLQPPQLDEGFERIWKVRVLVDVSTGQHRYAIEPAA